MSIELPLSIDDETATEIRDDLADGKKVTLQIEGDAAGELPDVIDYQLETDLPTSAVTDEYREWKTERDETDDSGGFF